MYTDKKIAAMQERVNQEFLTRTPKSREQHGRSRGYWLRGVPMHWMVDWQCAYPLYIDRAVGVTMTDLDGNEYSDFCLGDTGSMFGHSTPEIVEALTAQASRGITTMKPSVDAEAVGQAAGRPVRHGGLAGDGFSVGREPLDHPLVSGGHGSG